MACKYLIKLRSGKIIEVPTSLQQNDQYTSQDFRNVLHELSKEDLEQILKEIGESENTPIDVKSLNLKNIIKTTTLGNIKYFNSNVYYNDPVTAQLYENSKNLIDLLESVGENTKTRSIIYTNTQDKFDPNYGNAYDLESNTFVINSNPIGEINFIALNKGLIDMYILKHSENLQNLIKTQFSDVQEFLENMPFLYRKKKINQKIINGLINELKIDPEVFDFIYDSHSENKKQIVYSGKVSGDMKLFADYIANKFGKLQQGDNKKYYYGESESSKNYPLLNVGDLVKVKSKNYKNGIFGIYLDHYEVNNKRHYIILFPGIKNIYKSFIEDDLKFNDKFIYQKNIISESAEDVKFDTSTPLNKIEPGNSVFIDLNDQRIPNDLIKLLKKGDKFTFQYLDKTANKTNKLKQEVVDIIGNTLLYRNNTAKSSDVKKSLIGGKIFISAIEFDLNNHPEFNEFDVIEFRNKRAKQKLAFPLMELNDNNKELELNNLSKGDIVLSKMNNGSGAYHNYYVGTVDNNIVTLGRSSGELKMITIPKNDIIGIIHDISDKKELISRHEEIKDSVNKSFNTIITTSDNKTLKGKDENAINNNRYSVYNVNNSFKLSDTLKKEITSGDYVQLKTKNYLVIENNDGVLKLYNDNILTKDNISNVTKILKVNFEPTVYVQKTLQMNSKLINTKVNLEEMFKNTSFEVVPVKYVIHNSFKDSYVWEGGFVKQGYIVDENYYNSKDSDGILRSSKLTDISDEYSEQNLEQGDSLFAIKQNGGFINNSSGTTRYDIHNMSINEAIKLLSVGSYISITNTHKTFRIEEISENGLLVSYAYRDSNGNVSKNIEFLTLNYLSKSDLENNIYSLFVPNVQTIVNDKLKNYKESITKKIQDLVTIDDNHEVLKMISEYLEDKFKIPIVIGTTNDFISNNELDGVSLIESANSFIKNGKIYINSDFASISDPIHEISHLITGTLKNLNPKLYEQLLQSVKWNEELLNNTKDKYKELTYYELLEETFAEQFAKNITGELLTKEFNDDNFLSVINQIMNEMFQFSEISNNTNKLLTTPIYQLINEFGSNFINNPESLYDRNASLLSNDINLAKKELVNMNKLIEKCK